MGKTLPPGNDRNKTLRTIPQKWRKEDAAGKEALAAGHGIS